MRSQTSACAKHNEADSYDNDQAHSHFTRLLLMKSINLEFSSFHKVFKSVSPDGIKTSKFAKDFKKSLHKKKKKRISSDHKY